MTKEQAIAAAGADAIKGSCHLIIVDDSISGEGFGYCPPYAVKTLFSHAVIIGYVNERGEYRESK